MAASMLLVAIGLPLLAVAQEVWLAMLAIVLIAPGFGGTIPVRPAMLADYFGTRTFGTVNGITALVMTTGGAIGPWVVGFLVDVTGGYALGWWVSAAVVVLGIPAILAATAPSALLARHRPATAAPRGGAVPEQ
jgi:MFS family permease